MADFLDNISLPGISGIELGQRIKTLTPATPFIICTGHSDKVSADSAAALGFDAFIEKPISMANLAETLGGLRQTADR